MNQDQHIDYWNKVQQFEKTGGLTPLPSLIYMAGGVHGGGATLVKQRSNCGGSSTRRSGNDNVAVAAHITATIAAARAARVAL